MTKNYAYILRCGDGSLYTGWTNDLKKRLESHNSGSGSKCTRARLPVELAYFEIFPTKEQAMSREYHIKQLKKAEKERLIAESTCSQRVRRALFDMQDEKYRDFTLKLVPTAERDSVIGVRMPQLRAYAKALRNSEERREFLTLLPHGYYEENNLHGEFINMEKDFETALSMTEEFLPHVDNWATCDMLNPKVFAKNRQALLERIKPWLKSGETYTVRFALDMLMGHFLGEDFTPDLLQLACGAECDEYYVNMALAWFMSEALAKQYDAAVKVIEAGTLEKWTHNKSIQKAVESNRISTDTKAYLKTLKKK